MSATATSSIIDTNTNRTNGSGKRSSSSALDAADVNHNYFIPASTWQGVKPGYYFGTSDGNRTGYYLDTSATANAQSQSNSSNNKKKKPAAAASRKSVQIAEDRNETRTIPSLSSTTTTTTTAEALLAEAEQHAVSSGNNNKKLVTLTVAGVKTASAALKKAVEANALQRAKHQTDCGGGGGDDNDSARVVTAAATTSATRTSTSSSSRNNSTGMIGIMESEVALYEHICALEAFSAADDNVLATLYPALLEQHVLADLVQLLLHDNVDICVAVTAVLLEWLDADLVVVVVVKLSDDDNNNNTNSGDQEEKDGTSSNSNDRQRRSAVAQMAAAFLASEGPELLVENLARMQLQGSGNKGEDDDDDSYDEVGRGVDDVLSLLENLLEMDASLAGEPPLTADGTSVAAFLCKETAFVPWIFEQLRTNDGPHRNRAVELLAYLAPREDVYTVLQDWSRIPPYSSTFAGDDKKHGKNETTSDGIEILLQSVAAFRKRQPSDEQEVEFLENCCMVLASALTYSAAAVTAQAFLDHQGIELVMRCLKERVYAGAVALKWLDVSGSTDAVAYQRSFCEHLVEAGALKYIFPLFLGRNLPKHYDPAIQATASTVKQKKAKKEFQLEIEGTTIRILYAFTRHLRDDSPNDAKERVLAKFVDAENDENDQNEKVNRLVELLLAYDQRARLAEYKFFRSDVEETLLLLGQGQSSGDKGNNKSDDSMIQLAALEAKLAAGGDILHRLAAIAGFCCTGSKRCHKQILAALHAKESGIGLIREALEEFVSVLGDSEQKQQLQSYLEQI